MGGLISKECVTKGHLILYLLHWDTTLIGNNAFDSMPVMTFQ